MKGIKRMHVEELLRKKKYKEIWEEYCGFLDLSMKEYMQIQYRLLEEQLQVWLKSSLGQNIMQGRNLRHVEDFRHIVPLTTYEDYADILLNRREQDLPGKPVTWIETTWEAGRHPVKCAPYTQEMLQVFKNNMMACLILAGSETRNDVVLRPHDKALYGVASLPYATGLLPILVEEELTLDILPPVELAEKLSFKERNVLGFKMGVKQGIDIFFALSSVAYYVSMAFSTLNDKKSSAKDTAHSSGNIKPKMAYRLMKGSYQAQKEHRSMLPKDVFHMKCFLCAGTDSQMYKPILEKLWGKRPHEIFAGTEPTCIASENWSRNGMYFFPDACFYEFMPIEEAIHFSKDHTYQPKTYLMNEVIPHEEYELVVTVFKGGAFMRYMTKDRYRCIATHDSDDHIQLPRFTYVDRSFDIIDIAGFTRISQQTIEDVIKMSKLDIVEWVASKEYDDFRPYMHLIIEMSETGICQDAVLKKILKEHLQIYFTYFDGDYEDLQTMLGIDPLKITIVRCHTFGLYRQLYGEGLSKMNPSKHHIQDLLALSRSKRGETSCS